MPKSVCIETTIPSAYSDTRDDVVSGRPVAASPLTIVRNRRDGFIHTVDITIVQVEYDD